ncbi:hypothetical protein PABG_02081 [Paracoccidioides brasiliensis Pb03]|nr:hypothetical protein PABG_02081 [Paracoccidioides brasiliensis Pb03]
MHATRLALLATVLQTLFLCRSTFAAVAKAPRKSCTIYSPTNGAYFDLNTISLSPPEVKDGKKVNIKDREESWHAKGYDYPANFTINICAPVIEDLKDVVGVEESRWGNVSAYYRLDGKTYSIGQQQSSLVFRGRKLSLNYTDGSPCPASSTSNVRSREIADSDKGRVKEHDRDSDKDKGGDSTQKTTDSSRRKSTLMSFLCDRDLVSPAATVSFVGALDSCSYFFEVRSAAACDGVARSEGGLGPAGVFGVIALIAVAAYFLGGCAYQRTVMHQRGWRQCPNYSLWAGAASFLRDLSMILCSFLSRCFRISKSTAGYSRFSNGNYDANDRHGGIIGAIGACAGTTGAQRRRGPDVDAENRLIDQLDEEWDV